MKEDRELPVVRPKQREKREEEKTESQEVQGFSSTKTSSGHWWHSSALTGKMGPRLPTAPPSRTRFQGWREWQWANDEEGEWSYSTGPGVTTMDILRERFGEASFRDAPSWQPWAPSIDPSVTWQGGSGAPVVSSDSRFRLVSPKLQVEGGKLTPDPGRRNTVYLRHLHRPWVRQRVVGSNCIWAHQENGRWVH